MFTGTITIEGDAPDTPQQKAEVVQALVRTITADPAEGVMLLMVCMVRISRRASEKPDAVRMATLQEMLATWAPMAVDEMWPDEASEAKETLQ